MEYLRPPGRRASPEARAIPKATYLTRLIQGEKDGERLSETELHHNCIFLLNAGHETTTNLIGNGLWLLLAIPTELERLRANPASAAERDRRNAALRRPDPAQQPAPHRAGHARRHTLPRRHTRSRSASARRTAIRRISLTPERFDVGRKPNRHVAFGHGDHACAGMNVARMEARIAFSAPAGAILQAGTVRRAGARPAHPLPRLPQTPAAGRGLKFQA